MKKILLLILLLPTNFIAHAQFRAGWKTITLPTPQLGYCCTYDIETDLNGKIYFGTGGGLYVHSDTTWTLFQYPSQMNTCCAMGVAVDQYQNVWLGTNAGINKLDSIGNWTYIDTTNSSLPFNYIENLKIDHSGKIWITGRNYSFTRQAIASFDGNTWTLYDSLTTNNIISNQSYKILIDNSDNKWFIGMTNHRLYRYDGLIWDTIPLNIFGNLNLAIGFACDSSNILWVTSTEYLGDSLRLVALNNGTPVYSSIATDYGYTLNGDQDITIDNLGNKWVINNDLNPVLNKFDGTQWSVQYDSIPFSLQKLKFINNELWFGSNPIGGFGSDIYVYNERGSNSVKGDVFLDANGNGTEDQGEIKIPNQIVQLLPQNEYVFSTQLGYQIPLADSTGSYSVKIFPLYNSISQHTIQNFSQNHLGQITDSINFDLTFPGTFTDVRISATSGRFRPGFNSMVWINYENICGHDVSDTISIVIDSQLTFVSSVPTPDYNLNDTIKWYYNNLIPFESRLINLQLNVSSNSVLGDTLNLFSTIGPFATDTFPADNVSIVSRPVVGSFDPNLKEVEPAGLQPSGSITANNNLTYTLHFQNTGSDTAFTVVIRDTLSSYLDIGTLEILGSSNPVTTQLYGRVLIFTFNNILLPDSSVNNVKSSGFVRYQIRPSSGILDGSIIRNKAAIYFDYNQPVLTNEVVNTIDLSLYVNSGIIYKYDIIVYPNPVTSQVSFKSNSTIDCIEILDANEKEIMQFQSNELKQIYSIDVSRLIPGIYFARIISVNKLSEIKFVKVSRN